MNAYRKSKRRAGRGGLRFWLKGASPGQAIILIMLVMVGLIGFTALAIDGGELFFLQRDAQNAVDAAIVAGVYALCADQDPVPPAMQAAAANGFDDADDDIIVVVENPYQGSDSRLRVTITADKPARLIQLVYQGPLQVQVTASGYCEGGGDWTEIGAMFAGGVGCGGGLNFSGSNVVIEGGIHGNGGVHLTGSSGDLIGDVEAAGGFQPADPGDTYTITGTVDGNADVVTPPEIWDIDDFKLGGTYAQIAQANGQYYHFTGNINKQNLVYDGGDLAKGIYFVEGNIAFQSADAFKDKDTAGITWVATGTINLAPADVLMSPYSAAGLPPMPLAFANNEPDAPLCTVNKGITIASSSADFLGVLYAPNGLIKISLSEGQSLDGALVSYVLDVSGSSFEIHFDPMMFPPWRPTIGLGE